VLTLAGAGIGWVGLVAAGGEAQTFAVTGLLPLPFLVLAALGYAGNRHDWARALTVLYWFLLVGFAALIPALVSSAARVAVRREYGLGVLLAVLLGGLCFTPRVRRWIARATPLNPEAFVHATALALVVGMTGIVLVTLLAQGSLLALLDRSQGLRDGDSDVGRGLRLQVYMVAWWVPAAFLAVAFPLKRNLCEARERLGLVWPTTRQVLAAVGLALLLVVVITGINFGLTKLWEALGWPRTDTQAVSKVIHFAISPVGALVVGLTAGLGEELVFRGVLQPRLGVFFANLLFTAAHGFQYHFEALTGLFLLGLILGLIRKRSNTTTAAIVHGTYDGVLLLLASIVADQ
jgi:membrane protease YdiL (CAAX protease family)